MLIAKAPPAHGGAAKEQIGVRHLAGLLAAALDLLFGLVGLPAVTQGLFLNQSTDPRSDIVRVVLPEVGYIDHDSSLDRNLNQFPLLHVESVPVILKMMHA